jgi:hypothetical protein
MSTRAGGGRPRRPPAATPRGYLRQRVPLTVLRVVHRMPVSFSAAETLLHFRWPEFGGSGEVAFPAGLFRPWRCGPVECLCNAAGARACRASQPNRS